MQKPEILKKFVPEELIANDISRFFAKILYINDLSEDERRKLFIALKTHVSMYILKPQREGGGNNYYHEDILKILPQFEINSDSENNINNLDVSNNSLSQELRHLLVMDRVNPEEYDTAVLHDNKLKKMNCISEVSVYGIILSSDKIIYMNKAVGFLLRTKEKSSQEGGVIGGFSAIDMPLLI